MLSSTVADASGSRAADRSRSRHARRDQGAVGRRIDHGGHPVALAEEGRRRRPAPTSRSSSWRPTRRRRKSSPRRPAGCASACRKGTTVASRRRGRPASRKARLPPADQRSRQPANRRTPAAERGRRRSREPASVARRPASLAEASGIDPTQLTGTGRGGRITKEDVLEHPTAASGRRARQPATAAPSRRAAAPALTLPARRAGRRETRQRMSAIRQRIAERLRRGAADDRHPDHVQRSRHVAPSWSCGRSYKDTFKEKHGVGLGFMSFFVKACVEALQGLPRRQRPHRRRRHRLPALLRHRRRRQHREGADGAGAARRRPAELRRDREEHRRAGRQGPRRQDQRRRPARRHVHDHQRRRLRLAAVDADPQPAAERPSSACTPSRSGRSPSTTRSSSGR